MDFLRTPEERFDNLPDFPFEPHYVEVMGLRMHYLDEGPADAAPVLLMHGEPSWCFLYRKMIPIITAAGHRVIAPDLIGFGRSDKPTRTEDYSYKFHVDTVTALITELDLRDATFFGQDWGGLVGLRVIAENPDRFARVVVGNTGLPTGDHKITDAFMEWREFSRTVPEFPIGPLFQQSCQIELSPEVMAGYDAPFPDESYKAGARIFPSLVPISPDDPASEANRRAWEVFTRWDKPFLTAFSDRDPVTKGGDAIFQKLVPGAKDQPHTTIEGAGHFLQEDKGEEVAQVILDFIAKTSP
jgi:haloalkane dehalogenase